jgi:hypothetical protein
MVGKVNMEFLTLIWSSKEALFKWYGNGKLDFKSNMQLYGNIKLGEDEWLELSFLFSKNNKIETKIKAKFFSSLVLAYILSDTSIADF